MIPGKERKFVGRRRDLCRVWSLVVVSGVHGWSGGAGVGGLRQVAAPFVALGPSGVAVRTRLKQLTPTDVEVLRRVGAHLGTLASRDLKARCRDGLEHDAGAWAVRKRELTPVSSARWAGAITKASHDQWALARRCALAHIQSLEAGVRTLRQRLSLPIGQKGGKGAPGGYRSRREWHAKTRRLHVLEARLERARTDWTAGTVHVVRGGKRLARVRHHLPDALLTESQWRARWEAERWFLQAEGRAENGSGTRPSASAPTVRSASDSPLRSGSWPTPHTAGMSSPAGWRLRTAGRNGPTASRRTGPSPTASTTT